MKRSFLGCPTGRCFRAGEQRPVALASSYFVHIVSRKSHFLWLEVLGAICGASDGEHHDEFVTLQFVKAQLRFAFIPAVENGEVNRGGLVGSSLNVPDSILLPIMFSS